MTTPPSKHRKLLRNLLFAAVGMFGFGFLLVPMYNVFCKVTGLNGKTSTIAFLNSGVPVDTSRTVTVQFITSVNGSLPWTFYPLTESIQIHPGEIKRVVFYAKNRSSQTMTVQAIPSVSPGLAAKFLKKTECFCFTRQTFKAGEVESMPVLFHLDPALPKNIHLLTLSYTLFDANIPKQHTLSRGHFVRDD